MIAIAASFMPGLAVIFTAGDGIRYAAMRPVILDEKHSGRHSGWKFDPLCGTFSAYLGPSKNTKPAEMAGQKSHTSLIRTSVIRTSLIHTSASTPGEHPSLFTVAARRRNPANVIGLYCSKGCQGD
jgi:hypothetical protein